MALETVEGHRVLSHGEFNVLMKNLEPSASSGDLGVWFFGGPLPAARVEGALRATRLVARNAKAHKIIDRALSRLGA